MKQMTGIQSQNHLDETINSICYHKYHDKKPTECLPRQYGTDLHVVLDCVSHLLHFKPALICFGIDHEKQIMKLMYWTNPKNRLYYNNKDQIVDKLIVWTPRTPQQQAERSNFSRRKQITQRCLTQLMSMVLNC